MAPGVVALLDRARNEWVQRAILTVPVGLAGFEAYYCTFGGNGPSMPEERLSWLS